MAETVWVRVLNLHPTRQAVLELILRAPVLPMLTMVFSAVVLAPVYEELIFRAFIQKGIEKTLGRWPAICVTAIIFAAVHGSPLVILKVLPFSIALSVAYDRSRSILANILFQEAFNPTSLIAALAAKQAGLDLLI